VRKYATLTLIIIGIFAVSLTLSLPSIKTSTQKIGYGEAQTMVWYIIASNPSSQTLINYPGYFALQSADVPGYKNLFSKTVVVAADSGCRTPIPYWVETKNSSYILLWFKISSLGPSQATSVYICAVNSYTSNTYSDPEVNGLFPYFTSFGTSTPLSTTNLQLLGDSTPINYSFASNGLLVYQSMSENYEGEIFFLTTAFTGPAPYYIVIFRVSVPTSTPGYFGIVMYSSSTSSLEVAYNLQVLYSSYMLWGGYYFVLNYGGWIGSIVVASTSTTLYTGSIINSYYRPFFYIYASSQSFALGNYDDNYNIIGTYIVTAMYGSTYTYGIVIGRASDGYGGLVTEKFLVNMIYVLPYNGYFPDLYLGGVIYIVSFT